MSRRAAGLDQDGSRAPGSAVSKPLKPAGAPSGPSGRSRALSAATGTLSTALAALRVGDRLHLRWDPAYADPDEADVVVIAAPEPDEHRPGDWTVEVQRGDGMPFTIFDAEIRDRRLEVTPL